jgi:glycosyltransferase involved in cell wall biosynthesis
MRKKRILFCSEASHLNTGYAGYTREVLSYLYSTNKYEIAELGCYATDDYESKTPWLFYGVSPSNPSPEEQKAFMSSMSNQFGEYKFAEVCLEFLPDIVCDIRDFWMLEFEERSPLRKFYNWVIMPTVDAAPQATHWLMTYASADICLTYSSWAEEVLRNSGLTNVLGAAPPSAHRGLAMSENKQSLREKYPIMKDKFVIGTVMRNQRRKLYPDLFEAFSKLLKSVENPEKYLLYCHTSFPDMGWDLPEILLKNGISNNVLFTYVCRETNKIIPHQFAGPTIPSPFKEGALAGLTNVKSGVSIEQFNEIYNFFDLYVQYANSEGFGLPQVEAAACGVAVMSVDYSAMSSVIRKLGGFPLKPKALYKEMETGCMRAVPDNDDTASRIKEFFQLTEQERKNIQQTTHQNFVKHFSWEESGKKWEQAFDSLPLRDFSETWFSSPNFAQPDPPLSDENLSNISLAQIVDHLIYGVLQCPEKHYAHFGHKITRDLKYGYSHYLSPSVYCNDSSMIDSGKSVSQFNYKQAYEICYSLRMQMNQMEQIRANKLLGSHGGVV